MEIMHVDRAAIKRDMVMLPPGFLPLESGGLV
jgi:hypothetical protein